MKELSSHGEGKGTTETRGGAAEILIYSLKNSAKLPREC